MDTANLKTSYNDGALSKPDRGGMMTRVYVLRITGSGPVTIGGIYSESENTDFRLDMQFNIGELH